MGQSQSSTAVHRTISTEQLSHELALRFASKCYSHLEIAHFKDNFKTLADHQDDIEFWKEETLCRFLCLPDQLSASPVIYQMCTYLGAFPFPSLAPYILTREAMLKVITIMTSRYRKVLKNGDQDKLRLLYRSLAVFDRRTSIGWEEQPNLPKQAHNTEEDKDQAILEDIRSHVAGFDIDKVTDEDEDEDEDDLALAALESLDAIEVFKVDQKKDKKIHHARIPVEHLRNLLMVLLAIAPLGPQEAVSNYTRDLTEESITALGMAADSIIKSLQRTSDPGDLGIRYGEFVRVTIASLPNLFEPLNPLFEHFLFSKNIDVTKRPDPGVQTSFTNTTRRQQMIKNTEGSRSILNDAILAQVSTFLNIKSMPLVRSSAQLNQIYSTSSDGTSLSSFSRQVLSWKSATLLLIAGNRESTKVLIGAYLPDHWTESKSKTTSKLGDLQPVLFQLAPRHAVFPANPYNSSTPVSYFSSKTGIALGCVIPSATRTNAPSPLPALGPVSLLIDADISNATFQHDAETGIGAFLTDSGLENAQTKEPSSNPKKINFEIDELEVWGINLPDADGQDEAVKQKQRLAWEEAEAARRRGVNFGGDKDGARALLELAGLVGDNAGGRTGGSV